MKHVKYLLDLSSTTAVVAKCCVKKKPSAFALSLSLSLHGVHHDSCFYITTMRCLGMLFSLILALSSNMNLWDESKMNSDRAARIMTTTKALTVGNIDECANSPFWQKGKHTDNASISLTYLRAPCHFK